MIVASMWYTGAMPRIRVSTTVDDQLLASARRLQPRLPDSLLLDQALSALLALYREAEVDAAYDVYDRLPLDAPDEWGDLASSRSAAS
jgi:hypothetical protein